jgi:hypothetical protein
MKEVFSEIISLIYMDTWKAKKEFRLQEYFHKQMESGWNARFTVLYSKDNGRFHKTRREYFDCFKRFDPFYRDRFEEVAALGRVVSTRGAYSKNRQGGVQHSRSQRVLFDAGRTSLNNLGLKKIHGSTKKKVSVLEL